MAGALAEFTAIKGVDVAWRTGWISDRAAAFLALGRPVITEATGAEKYLPAESGFRFVRGPDEAESAVKEVLRDWPRLSRRRAIARRKYSIPRKICGKFWIFSHGVVLKKMIDFRDCKTNFGCYSLSRYG